MLVERLSFRQFGEVPTSQLVTELIGHSRTVPVGGKDSTLDDSQMM